VYNRFLAPEHGVVMRTRAINAAHQSIVSSNYAEALSAIERGKHEIDDPDWELLTWQAVLLAKLEQPSQAVLAEALEAGAFEDVWITYGMVALLVDEPSRALTAGERLTEQDSESVQGYYLLAQAYDALERVEEALIYYEQVMETIDQTGGNEGIYITVRQRVAQLNLELLQDEIACCD
jgi:tetratricopeptide (TPR) repeat protein